MNKHLKYAGKKKTIEEMLFRLLFINYLTIFFKL